MKVAKGTKSQKNQIFHFLRNKTLSNGLLLKVLHWEFPLSSARVKILNPLREKSMISIIQRYLAKEWIKWFCLSVFFLISLLSLQLIAEDLDSVYDWESTIQELGISTIAYIPWIFPIACFVATLLTISFLTMRGEMLGIQACSLSWVHCFTPICLIGCFVSFVSWFVMKWETEFLDFVNHDYSKQVESSFFRMKIGSDRLWYFENFDFQKIVGKKVHFYAYDANGNDAYRIRASLAFWSEGRE